MIYIFLDESGDLGFSKNSSKWFLFTIVITDNPRQIEKIIKKIRKGLKKKFKKNQSELHAYHADEATRNRVLSALVELDITVLTTILNKEKVHIDLKNQKNYLYNYTANIFLDRLIKTNLIDHSHDISLIIDKKDTNKNIRENFVTYITSAMKRKRHGEFKMSLNTSHKEKCLQAVDFISWAIFRKYEKGDISFYNIIKSKIVEESFLFK